MTTIQHLKTLVSALPEGPIVSPDSIISALSAVWGDLRGSNDTSMDSAKLSRIESPRMEIGRIRREIERHGATVKGSTRADSHTLEVNLDEMSATIVGETHRQISAMDKPLNAAPIAVELAVLIDRGVTDERFTIQGDEVRIRVGRFIHAENKRTLANRRTRFSSALTKELEKRGWRKIKANHYTRAC